MIYFYQLNFLIFKSLYFFIFVEQTHKISQHNKNLKVVCCYIIFVFSCRHALIPTTLIYIILNFWVSGCHPWKEMDWLHPFDKIVCTKFCTLFFLYKQFAWLHSILNILNISKIYLISIYILNKQKLGNLTTKKKTFRNQRIENHVNVCV